MAKFNAISLETGKIRKTIIANSYNDAVKIISNMFNCYAEESFIIETASETEQHRAQQVRYWDLQTL